MKIVSTPAEKVGDSADFAIPFGSKSAELDDLLPNNLASLTNCLATNLASLTNRLAANRQVCPNCWPTNRLLLTNE